MELPHPWGAFLQGFGLVIGLIITIGPQNAFILRQGLIKQYVLMSAVICATADTLLICAGVLGLGWFIVANPELVNYARIFGGVFLFCYGLKSMYSAMKKHRMHLEDVQATSRNRFKVILILFALTFLNPYVYLDTVVLVGSIGGQLPEHEHLPFAIGASLASWCWFFALSFGSRYLTPLFRSPRAWQILDVIIGLIMWGIAIEIVLPG